VQDASVAVEKPEGDGREPEDEGVKPEKQIEKEIRTQAAQKIMSFAEELFPRVRS